LLNEKIYNQSQYSPLSNKTLIHILLLAIRNYRFSYVQPKWLTEPKIMSLS